MRDADRLTIQGGISGFELLSSAGQQVYEVVRNLVTQSDQILVACGNGNNGGDGLVAAKLLIEQGFDVTVSLCNPADKMTEDASLALKALDHPVSLLSNTPPDNYTVIIDAILGSGIDRPISGELADWIGLANNSKARLVSVDIPSGVCGDSGIVLGMAIKADHTVTFFRKKTGNVLYPGRDYCGQIHLKQIGIDDSILDVVQPRYFENGTALWLNSMPLLGWDSHKYTRGHAVVATGNSLNTGAARLAARAALRSGAGLVTLACPTDAVPTVAAQVSCEMLKTVDTVTDFEKILEDERVSSLVLGPALGVGSFTRKLVHAALSSSVPVVLDADALTSFETCPTELFQLIANASSDVVITPHSGEFDRLFNKPIQSMLAKEHESVKDLDTTNKIAMAIAAATLSGAVVVHKGPDTVIATPTGNCVVNTNAPPWLATAGSGDVLAGTIAGWLAQGVPGFDAACAGCWIHAESAAVFGNGLIATDLAKQYPQIIAQLVGLPKNS